MMRRGITETREAEALGNATFIPYTKKYGFPDPPLFGLQSINFHAF